MLKSLVQTRLKANYTRFGQAYQSLLRKWYALWNEPEYNEAVRKVKVRKECEARLAADKPDRYQNNLNRFIAEGRATLRAFALQIERTSTTKRQHPSTMASWLLPIRWNWASAQRKVLPRLSTVVPTNSHLGWYEEPYYKWIYKLKINEVLIWCNNGSNALKLHIKSALFAKTCLILNYYPYFCIVLMYH